MPHDTEDMIQLLLNTNKEQEQTIVDLRATIKELRSTIANLNETIDELKRKIFGTSSEKTRRPDQEEGIQEEETVTVVKEHTRTRRKKSVRADLYEALPMTCSVFHGESFLSRYAVFCTARALISSKVRSVKAAISS